ncbi:MAG: hypothetical protein LVR00_08365 [Rhabdochlamydiaceae bacterium]|jgi:hypothetical protein
MKDCAYLQESAAFDGTFSMEHGFNITLYFFNYLWSFFKEEIKIREALSPHDCHEIFFRDVCMGFESSPHWNEAVSRMKGIPKEKQRSLRLTEKEVFLCTVEFCKLWNEIFRERIAGSNIDALQHLLESMQTKPEQHAEEWAIWEKAIRDSFNTGITYLDWTDELPPRGER